MKFHPVWIVWLLACISLVLCQNGVGTDDATKRSILSEVSKLQDFEATMSQKPPLALREEQIEDELSNGASTTEKFMGKSKYAIKPVKENEESREIFTDRSNEPGSTTVRNSVSSTTGNNVSFQSSINKYDGPEDVSDVDDIDVTTSFGGLTKKLPVDNGERKTKQRLDGLKSVTTNRGKTRFQNEPETSELPEISTTLRHKKPIRVKPVNQNVKDETTTLIVDDLMDVTTVLDNSEVEQPRPKFKKPPLIATHHPNFGTSTETSRRPVIRPNLNLKQKITSSTIKTRQSEPDFTEPENIVIPSNKTLEIVSSNTQSNKIRPIKVIATKGLTAQQPIPPTATAWALASLKAPNNTNRIFRKPHNVTNIQEQLSKIRPFVTWSTRLQKTNDDNSNTTSSLNNTLINDSNDPSAEIPTRHIPNESSTVDNRLTPEITSTESLIRILSTLSTGHVSNGNDSTETIVGGDTDQNKYEVYGSQKPEAENATTIIETLRPSSSTKPSESQNSNLLLVTSYKSILENNNTSEVPAQNYYTSSEIPISENTSKIEITKDEFTNTTEHSNVFKNIGETPTSEHLGDSKLPMVQTSTEMFSKTPGLLFNYSDDRYSNKLPTTTTRVEPSSSNEAFSISHGIDLSNLNHSTTTEYYIESIKTKLDGKMTESTDNHDLLEMVDFTHMFSSELPVNSSVDGIEVMYAVSEKTTSEPPLPTSEISNTSQVPNWFNSPGTFITDFESNFTDSHDDTGDDVQKNFESSSQNSAVANESTPESDISENDVPIIMPSSSTSTSSTTSTTTMIIPKETTTIDIPRPTTTTTTTSTTPIPPPPPPPPPPTTTTTTTITTQSPTIVPKLTTTQRTNTSTSSPIVIETTTPISTTKKFKPPTTFPPTTTLPPSSNKPTTVTSTPNSITSKPKPTWTDIGSITLAPNLQIFRSYLKVLVNSTVEDICESEDELKAAIIKLFESGTGSVRTENQIGFLNINENECLNPDNEKRPVGVEFYLINSNGENNSYLNEEFINLLDNHRFDYKSNIIGVEFMKQFLGKEDINKDENQNPRVKAAIYLTCVASVCTVLVLILLVVRKRQKRFNYGQRCTPVSLDDYSMDNISVYNSVRRKGALRASKRSYGNPAFDDTTAVSHPLTFAGLASFSEDRPAVDEEFSNVPAITVKPDELPPGAETKNRYANVIPMPETRVVLLNPRGSGHNNSDYINANFVKGYKGAEKFYIACQAPMQSTLPEFWQMIWEQNSRVIMMVTGLTEKGVERCADYLPPSEVLDCHRLFGDYQVTLKKREVKEKFIISSLQLKNLETNLWRDVTHLWYGGWPVQGVPSDPCTMLTYLMEARSHMKTNNGPHVVHCSPGTGRTGTVIACDIAIREFEQSRTVDVPKTVYAIRRCRAGAVQTRDQYALIYKVVNLYASKLSGGVLDSI